MILIEIMQSNGLNFTILTSMISEYIKPAILLSILFIISCSAGEQSRFLTKHDSIRIVQLSLESRLFLKENLSYSDTLYIVKNKNYPVGDISASKHFTLIYIEDSPANKEVIHPIKNPFFKIFI